LLALLVLSLSMGCVRGPSGSSQNSDGGEKDMSEVISDMTLADMNPVIEDQPLDLDQALPEDQNALVDMRLDLGDMHDSGFDMPDASVDMPWDMTADMLDMSPLDLGDMPSCDAEAERMAVCDPPEGPRLCGDSEEAVICGQAETVDCSTRSCGAGFVCDNTNGTCCNITQQQNDFCEAHRQSGGCGVLSFAMICGREVSNLDCGRGCGNNRHICCGTSCQEPMGCGICFGSCDECTGICD
jgi:hypothetical protein